MLQVWLPPVTVENVQHHGDQVVQVCFFLAVSHEFPALGVSVAEQSDLKTPLAVLPELGKGLLATE